MNALNRKTVLITGATSGHGRGLAERLSYHRLLLHGKDRERTTLLAKELGGEPYVADLSDLSQVQQMAIDIKSKHQHIDTVINNAGIGYGDRRETSVDGHELRFAVMYLAPVLLTHLLDSRIKSHVINIGSLGQEPINLADLDFKYAYCGIEAYRRAKFALTMATFDLAERRSDLKVNVVHPATYMNTKMIREGGGIPQSTVAEGVEATLSVMKSSLTGTFFNGSKASFAHQETYRKDSRALLRKVTERILEIS